MENCDMCGTKIVDSKCSCGTWLEEKKELPKVENGIFKVKLSTGDEIWAYFCRDKCAVLLKSFNMAQGKKTYMPTHWWSQAAHKPLYDVMYWGNDEI
jgi:hypothetical protein